MPIALSGKSHLITEFSQCIGKTLKKNFLKFHEFLILILELSKKPADSTFHGNYSK